MGITEGLVLRAQIKVMSDQQVSSSNEAPTSGVVERDAQQEAHYKATARLITLVRKRLDASGPDVLFGSNKVWLLLCQQDACPKRAL